VLQHRTHLLDVLLDAQARAMPPVFPASQYFSLLPPAGQLPAACVVPDRDGFQQFYFPPPITADLAFVPSDEIAALVDEALTLPPIDLQSSAEDLTGTGVVIVVPVSRPDFQRYSSSLPATRIAVESDASAGPSRPALDMLDALVLQRRKATDAASTGSLVSTAADALALQDKAWQAAFAEAVAALPSSEGLPPLLWFVRRRAVAYRTDTEGLPIAVGGDDIVISSLVGENLARLKLEKRLAAIDAQATPQASARAMALLGAPAIVSSDILTAAVIADLEKVSTPAPAPAPTPPRPLATATVASPLSLLRTTDLSVARTGLTRINLATALGATPAASPDTELNLSESEVLDVAADYGSARLGEGFAAIAPLIGGDWPTAKQAVAIGDSGVALELDAGLIVAKPDQLPGLADQVKTAATKSDADALAQIAKSLA
jgi:hypothetical protein